MPNPVQVELSWACVEWRPEDTWGKVLLPRLVEEGLAAKHLVKSVYVVRLAGNFTIAYPKGDTPAVYVGEGSFGSRIASHKKWARELEELIGDFTFQLCVCTPRVKNQPKTYLDCEAVILHRFGQRFGSRPCKTAVRPVRANVMARSRRSGGRCALPAMRATGAKRLAWPCHRQSPAAASAGCNRLPPAPR